MRNCVNQNGLFLGVFCGFPYFLRIFLNFWTKYYTWLESSGNVDSDATFPKSLGVTSKHTDFSNGGGKVVWPIAESLSYVAKLFISITQNPPESTFWEVQISI